MKELLDLLEERVGALMDEVQILQRENVQMKQNLADITGPLTEENSALRDALAQEQSARETAASRIDTLLQRLTKHTEE